MTITRYSTTSADLAISIMMMADHHGARTVAESPVIGVILITITTPDDMPVSTHPAPGGTIPVGGGGTWVLTGVTPEWVAPRPEWHPSYGTPTPCPECQNTGGQNVTHPGWEDGTNWWWEACGTCR